MGERVLLALHGKRQCGEIFHQRIDRLENRLTKQHNTRIIYPDAPFELPLEAGDDVPMRTWYHIEDDSINSALHSIETHLVKENINEIQGILGFSQGSVVACLVLLLKESDALTDYPRLGSALKRCNFVILAGCPHNHVPNLEILGIHNHDITTTTAPPLSIQSLHCLGEVDPVVPPASSSLVLSLFMSPHPFHHKKGHVVPTFSDALTTLCDFVESSFSTSTQRSQADSTALPPVEATEDQLDELESLSAIYEDDYELHQAAPPTFTIVVPCEDDKVKALDRHHRPKLWIRFPAAYPDTVPQIKLTHLAATFDVKRSDEEELALSSAAMIALAHEANDNLGLPMVMQLVQCATEWLEDHLQQKKSGRLVLAGKALAAPTTSPGAPSDASGSGLDQSATLSDAEHTRLTQQSKARHMMREIEDEDEMREMQQLIRKLNAEAAEVEATSGVFHVPKDGLWMYTVGLVGKPSAGKSTFFNAVTDPDRDGDIAQVAAFPFTTIDPNIGQGYFSVPCPSAQLGVTSTPSHGKIRDGERKVPIVIKDVAGLVPGAYKGRGKGNAFLNDLCDADVLIHVVDGSGQSDTAGVVDNTLHNDPSSDVDWIRAEIHWWVLNNVRAKWPGILKTPSKLLGMFTGYRGHPSMVYEACKRACKNFNNPTDLEKQLPTWTLNDLHAIVAHYLRIRFPILLALNKMDKSSKFVSAVAKRFPHDLVLPMSAATEWELCQLRREGYVEYTTGEALYTAVVPDTAPAKVHARVDRLHKAWKHVQAAGLTGTGVVDVVNAAVLQLRPPLLVYPVANITTFAGVPLDDACLSAGHDDSGHGKAHASAHKRDGSMLDGVLQSCLLLHPASTVDTVYRALHRPPLRAIEGDFVRAEGFDLESKQQKRLKKTDAVTSSMCIVHIMTNKKKAWQQQAHTHSHASA
eukprot:m.213181 g.213181  ORF g.213181 m.213181 type:complete len:921 (+) comp15082_c0_seq2:90-2852(+)